MALGPIGVIQFDIFFLLLLIFMRYTGIIKSVGYRNKKSKQKIKAFHQLM